MAFPLLSVQTLLKHKSQTQKDCVLTEQMLGKGYNRNQFQTIHQKTPSSMFSRVNVL